LYAGLQFDVEVHFIGRALNSSRFTGLESSLRRKRQSGPETVTKEHVDYTSARQTFDEFIQGIKLADITIQIMPSTARKDVFKVNYKNAQ
jgi:hypothetical protein